jgi:hypothetical protein
MRGAPRIGLENMITARFVTLPRIFSVPKPVHQLWKPIISGTGGTLLWGHILPWRSRTRDTQGYSNWGNVSIITYAFHNTTYGSFYFVGICDWFKNAGRKSILVYNFEKL